MILTDKRLAELRATAMRQCYSCGGYNEYESCPTIVNMDGDEILALIDDLASLRADRDEAVGAALKVEQRNYDQAQEIKVLRVDNSTLEVRLHQMMDISADRGQTITAYERELLPLRKLREACEAVRAGVQDGMMWMEYSEQAAMLANKRWARWREALAACDEASAPTGDGE
jgi:hypothetical protein